MAGLTPSGAATYSGSAGLTIEGKIFTDATAHEAIFLYQCSNVTIRRCAFVGTQTGIRALECSNVTVEDCYCLNTTGPGLFSNFVQFDKVNGGLVRFNAIEHVLPDTTSQDTINIFKSSDVTVSYNQIKGHGTSAAGGGILLGDGGTALSFNNIAEYNILVNPGQYGIAIAGGTGHTMRYNQIYGEAFANSNVGMYVWDQYATPGFGSHIVTGNRINYRNASNVDNGFWGGGDASKYTLSGNSFSDSTLTAAIYTAIAPSY